MKKILNKEIGITLIALIVTIIVLLILAGITITMISGQNSILLRTGDAVSNTRDSGAKEEVSTAWSSVMMDAMLNQEEDKTSYLRPKVLNKYTSNQGVFEEVIKNQDESYTIKYRSQDKNEVYFFSVKQNGNIETKRGLNLNKSRAFMEKGEQLELLANIDEQDGEIRWSCSDSEKVSLSEENGSSVTITALNETTLQDSIDNYVTVTAKYYKDNIEVGEDSCKIMIGILGKKVNYSKEYTALWESTCPGWVILYYDDNNVYLITRGVITATSGLTIDGYNGTTDENNDLSDLNNYPAISAGLLDKTCLPDGTVLLKSASNNMKATLWLLDSTKWTNYVTKGADWAIGAPTIELYARAYDKANGTSSYSTISLDNGGYSYPGILSTGGTFPAWTWWNPIYYRFFWMAGPAGGDNGVIHMNGYAQCIYSNGYSETTSTTYRPVVCLSYSLSDLTFDNATSSFYLPNTTSNQ